MGSSLLTFYTNMANMKVLHPKSRKHKDVKANDLLRILNYLKKLKEKNKRR